MSDRCVRLAGGFALALCWLLVDAVVAQAQNSTTVTTEYTYNVDGALTSVTKTVDEEAPTVTYLTWDNFVPDTADPSSGAVTMGNGNLLGAGPTPGTSGLTTSFSFDTQDRLVGFSDATGAVSYTYHPTWLMASATKGSGDSLHFYYDGRSPPQITNIERAASGVLSRRLGPLRSLTDGTRQVLLRPRKDVAGVYDPDQQTFTPYSYDAYGEPSAFDSNEGESSGPDYELGDNPFRYAGEYRDPDWGGYYLRARWYDPSLHTFVSRDPVRNLNRYGYTAGNPIARIDPTGGSHKSWNKAIGRPLDKFLKPTEKSVAGRLFLGPLIGPLSILADPVGFWHSMVRNHGEGFILFGATVAAQLLTDGVLSDSNYVAAYAVRLLGDSIIGGATSYVAASSHSFHRFNRRMFFQGLEYTAGGISESRVIAGRGYRPFNMDLDDVIQKWSSEYQDLGENEQTLVFRFKQNATTSTIAGKDFGFLRGTNPLADKFDTGWYHEGMLAIGSDGQAWLTEVLGSGLRVQVTDITEAESGLVKLLQGAKTEFKFVGKFDETRVDNVFHSNPLQMKAAPNGINTDEGRAVMLSGGRQSYTLFGRNCQIHAGQILRNLGTPVD